MSSTIWNKREQTSWISVNAVPKHFYLVTLKMYFWKLIALLLRFVTYDFTPARLDFVTWPKLNFHICSSVPKIESGLRGGEGKGYRERRWEEHPVCCACARREQKAPPLTFFYTDARWFHTRMIRVLELGKNFGFVSVYQSGENELCFYLAPKFG